MTQQVESEKGLQGLNDFFRGGYERLEVQANQIRVGDVYVSFQDGGADLRVVVEGISPGANPDVMVIDGTDSDGVHRQVNLENLAPQTGKFRIERKTGQS